MLLSLTQRRPWVTLGVTLGLFFTSLGAVGLVGGEFIPDFNQGLFQINVKAASGASLDGTEAIVQEVERHVQEVPEVTHVFSTVGDLVSQAPNQGVVTVGVAHGESISQVQEALRPVLATVPGAEISIVDVSIFGSSAAGDSILGMPLQLELYGDDFEELERTAERVAAAIAKIPGTAEVRSTLVTDKPEVKLVPDRDLLSATGIAETTVTTSLRALVAGQDVGEYEVDGRQREVRVRLREAERNDAAAIGALSVSSPSGPLPMRELAKFIPGTGPVQIERKDRARIAKIQGNLQGRSLAEVTTDVTALMARTQLPEGMRYAYGGEVKQMQEMRASMGLMLVLAIVFVYMVLAAQFESLVQPIAIMVAMPLALIGAVFALIIAHQPLSLMSILGIVTLMGLVTKNAILLVEFANQLRDERGLPMREALLRAAPIRLRPILMTTLAMGLGMVPMAIGAGAGGEIRQATGIVILGGLVSSTLLTLFVVPSVYALLDHFTVRGREERRAKKRAPQKEAVVVTAQ